MYGHLRHGVVQCVDGDVQHRERLRLVLRVWFPMIGRTGGEVQVLSYTFERGAKGPCCLSSYPRSSAIRIRARNEKAHLC